MDVSWKISDNKLLFTFLHFFRNISEELQTSIEKLKRIYADTLSSYNKHSIDVTSKLHEIIHRRENDNLFEFAYENFADLCRFCFKLRADNEMEEIFEDSSEESLAASSDLILKINFTLYENVRKAFIFLNSL